MACGECGVGYFQPNTSSSSSGGETPQADQKLFKALGNQAEKIKFQIDSGAAITVMKATDCKDYPLVKCGYHRALRAANGTPIEDKGDKHVHLVGPNGGPAQVVRAGATNVVNNLLSVIALEDTGHRIVFGGNERYYEHKASGVRTMIARVKGEYVVEYDVIPYAQVKGKVEQGNGSGHARR